MGRAEDLFQRISDAGELAIDEFIAENQSEELFLDFKRSSDNGAGARLSDRDRENLAKAISGFANSEGGLIVWGVDCRPLGAVGDVAGAKFPIERPTRFKSWLESAVSGLTLPPHPSVQHLSIGERDQPGFVVTYIPKSYLAPHQCLRPMQYYMRAGSNFAPVPHGVLAGMFGRAPQPVIFHMWAIPPAELDQAGRARFTVGVVITNRSAAIARDVYLNVTLHAPGGSTIGAEFPDLQNWSATQAFGSVTQILCKEGFRLAPNVLSQPLHLVFNLVPPFRTHFFLKISTGCAGSPIKEFSHRLTPEQLGQLYDEMIANRGPDDARRRFVEGIIGGRSNEAEGM
jgi:hypothetical protein